MTVVTRFAPSPTGFLHIGGARTALFNWLFARHNKGKFHLRIEDTDKKRSTQEAIDAILDGLNWLGLDHDDEVIFQSKQEKRHAEIANQLLEEGKAYYCYCSPEELTAMREKARAEGKSSSYDGTWRDKLPHDAPDGIKPVVRIKAPLEGDTIIDDLVQGTVKVSNRELDDMILLRSDGSPTYMLAVVVDDHDMGVTHAIRGDDHLTNASRQKVIYDAMGWDTPIFAHIPLIHGADGAKLSKRHGALGVDAYRDMGFLPEALRNYLLRLGWSHGDDEIFSTEEAIKLFDTAGLGKSPSRLDLTKLANVNAHYIKTADNSYLAKTIQPLVEEKLGYTLGESELERVVKGMDGLKTRAKTTIDLAGSALFYAASQPLPLTDKAIKILENKQGKEHIGFMLPLLEAITPWDSENLEHTIKAIIEKEGLKLGDVMQALRVGVTWSTVSPSVFDVLVVLGKEESLQRLSETLENNSDIAKLG